MKKLGITRKKTYGYRERDEEKRKQFLERINQVDKSKVVYVYVDEAGFDNRDNYPYGYSLKGTRCYALKSGKRVDRVSWIAGLKEGKVFSGILIALKLLEHKNNGTSIENAVKKLLSSKLNLVNLSPKFI